MKIGLSVLVYGLSLLLLAGCGSRRPIVVHPRPLDTTTWQCPTQRGLWQIRDVLDRRGYSDGTDVGFTQTGMLDIVAGLQTDEPAADVLRTGLSDALGRCAMLTQFASAPFIDVELLAMQIDEGNGPFVNTMTGHLRYEVIVHDPLYWRTVDRFQATGHVRHSALSTSGFADQTVSEIIASSLPEFFKNLSRSERMLPLATAMAASSGEPPAVAAAPVQVSERRLLPEEQRLQFGMTLIDKGVTVVQVYIERTDAVSHPLLFRRQDFRVQFADGGWRVPLDPGKVRERIVLARPVVVGKYNYGRDLHVPSNGFDTVLEQPVLQEDESELDGVLFFDTDGSGPPTELQVLYEDLTTHARLEAVVPFPGLRRRAEDP
jgi:hypothetical protein